MASRPIDEKIVVMKLDNSDFKRKATETTGIFGKLKSVFSKSGDTNLKNVTKDLANIEKAANRVDMGALSKSVDVISNRFSTLGVIATTTLTNITNKAVNAATALQHSLTTQQITDGFREYETKIGSIGTVLSNTEWAGTTLDDVKSALGELNDYADNTVYSFGQMTENIGRFTAAGVTLEDSTVAIKGLSNLAAASGSNVHQLNTAMYQMSQSMASGTMNLMDWNSLVNAGMGGKKTQDALLETARAMGKNVDMSEGFRNSISKGWLTSEVFLETMKKFGADESMTEAATAVRTLTGMLDSLKEGIGSGWAETWELIFGDYEQATRFWTAMSDALSGFFKKGTDKRNNFIKYMIDSGAIEKFGELIRNVGTPIVQVFKTIGEAFKTVFPPGPPTGLVNLIKSLADMTSGFKMSTASLENFKTIFQGMFSVVSIVVEVIKILASAVLGLIPSFGGAGGGVLDLVAKFAQLPIKISEYLKSGNLAEKITEKLKSVFSGFGSVLSGIGSAFSNTASFIGQSMSILSKGDFTGGAMEEDSNIVNFIFSIREAFAGLFEAIASINISEIGAKINGFFEGIGSGATWIVDKIKAVIEFVKSIPSLIGDNQGTILAGGGIAATAAIVWKIYESFKKVTGVVDDARNMFKGVTDVIEGASDVLEGANKALGAFTLGLHVKSLLTISIAVGILAASMFLLATLDGKQIAYSLGAVTGALVALVGALAIISKKELESNVTAILTLVALATAVGLLAIAVTTLGKSKPEEALRGVAAVSALLLALSGSVALMSKFGSTFTVGAAQMLAIGGAILLMTYALKQMAESKPEDLRKGLVTIGILLAELGLFVKMVSARGQTMIVSAAGVLAVAGAVLIMTQAIENLSTMKPDVIAKGLLTIGSILLAIGIFSVGVKDTNLLKTGAAIMMLAVAINALIVPILVLGNADWDVLIKGITGIGTALLALTMMSGAITKAIPAAITIGILAVALNLLVIPIMALGQLSWSQILTGVGGLALGLLAFGGVAAILGVVSPALILFSVAIAAVGVGFLALGAGMRLLATSLIMLSTLTVASLSVLAGSFAAFVTAAISMLPAVTDLIMKIILAMTEVMVKMAPQVADAVGRMLVVIMEKVVEYTPKILDLVGQLIMAILDKVDEFVPKIIELLGKTLDTVLEKLGVFIVDAVDTILEFLLKLISTIGDYIPKFIKAGTDLILGFLGGLQESIPQVIDAMAEFVVTLIDSMADTVDQNGEKFINAIMRLMSEVITLVIEAGLTMINALFGWIPGVSEATAKIGETAGKYIEENFKAFEIGDTKGVDFSKGVDGTGQLAKSAGESVANSGKSGMESVDASDSGEWFGSGFISGIASKAGDVYDSAWNLASQAYNAIVDRLDINSPSFEAYQLGEFTVQGYVNGVNDNRPSVMESLFGLGKGIDKSGKSMTKQATKQGTNIGYGATKGVSKGIKKGVPKAKKTAKSAAKDVASSASKSFNEKMDELEYKFEMGEIDHKKHIDGIKKLSKQYSKYPDLVRKANREIKKIEDDMEKERDRKAKDAIQREKNIFSKRKALIDDRKYYNTMSMKQELETWERMQARYKEGTDERKEADKEVYRLKKEMYQKMSDLNRDYLEKVKETNRQLIEDEKALNQEYEDSVLSRTQDIRSGLGGIFSEFKVDAEVSGTKLLDNLRSQLNGMMNWSRQLKELAAKGIDEGLLEELRQMGPSAASEIAALSKMTALELQEYSGIWKATNELARVEAVGELEWLREDIDGQIDELHKNSKQQLEEYKEEWLKQMREIRYGTPDEFDGLNATMESIGEDAMKGLLEGLKSMEGPLVNQAKSIANSVAKTMGEVLGANVSSGFISNSTFDKAKKGANAVKDAVNDVLGKINKDIKVNVSVDGDLPNGNVKMNANLGLPEKSHTERMLDSINQPTLNKTSGVAVPETASNDKTSSAINSLAAAMTANAEKPTVVPVYLDGKVITEVVSRNQYGNRNIGSMTRGVI